MQLTVAFDTSRLVRHWDKLYPVFGINRYVRTLHSQIKTSFDLISLESVIFVQEENDTTLLTFDSIVAKMRRAFGSDISVAWRKRDALSVLLVQMFAKVGGKVFGLQRTNYFLSRFASKNGQRNSLFQLTPFPDRWKWDVYHSPFGPLPPSDWTGKAARILTVHDCIYHKFPELYPHQGTAPITEILKSVNTKRDYVICDSENTRQDVLSIIPLPKEQTEVIMLAHDPIFAIPERHKALVLLRKMNISPGKYLLALGQTNPRKNITQLGQAFWKLQSNGEFEDYTLLLVTAKSQKNLLQSQLESSDISPNSFKIATDIDDETLASLYANAALFAYPSLYEGFGIPVLEAMAAGCPVVATFTSSVPELVEEAGQYVDPKSVDSISAGIKQVLSNKDLRQSLIERGKKQVSKFSWHKTIKDTVNFYNYVASVTKI